MVYKTPLHEKRDDGLCYTRKNTNLDGETGQTEATKLLIRVVLHRALSDGCRFH